METCQNHLAVTIKNDIRSKPNLVAVGDSRSIAGQLDIEKFLNYNKPFIIGTLNLKSTDYVPLHSSIYLTSGQTITASLAWQRNAIKKIEWIFWTTYTSAPLADLDIAITNSSGTVLLKSSAIYTNTEMIRYTAPSSRYYQLKFKPYSNYRDLKYINYRRYKYKRSNDKRN